MHPDNDMSISVQRRLHTLLQGEFMHWNQALAEGGAVYYKNCISFHPFYHSFFFFFFQAHADYWSKSNHLGRDSLYSRAAVAACWAMGILEAVLYDKVRDRIGSAEARGIYRLLKLRQVADVTSYSLPVGEIERSDFLIRKSHEILYQESINIRHDHHSDLISSCKISYQSHPHDDHDKKRRHYIISGPFPDLLQWQQATAPINQP